MTKRGRAQSFFPVPASGQRTYGPMWFMFQGLVEKGRHARGRHRYRGEGATTEMRRKLRRQRRQRRLEARASRRRNR